MSSFYNIATNGNDLILAIDANRAYWLDESEFDFKEPSSPIEKLRAIEDWSSWHEISHEEGESLLRDADVIAQYQI